MTAPLSKLRSRPLVKRQKRETCKPHLEYLASLGCCVPGCGAPASIHHLRVPGAGAAAGRRSSDRRALPVCHHHHQGPGGIHHSGLEAVSEEEWWRRIGVNPLALADRLWREFQAGGVMP